MGVAMLAAQMLGLSSFLQLVRQNEHQGRSTAHASSSNYTP
jgi:hypothetical protein